MSSSLAAGLTRKRESHFTTATHQRTKNANKRTQTHRNLSKAVGDNARATAHDLDNAQKTRSPTEHLLTWRRPSTNDDPSESDLSYAWVGMPQLLAVVERTAPHWVPIRASLLGTFGQARLEYLDRRSRHHKVGQLVVHMD